MRHRAEYFRAYRRHKLEELRAYQREYQRARYVRKIRFYPPVYRRPTRSELATWRARRLQELSNKTIVEIVTDPELIKLIEDQKRDDRTYHIKYGPNIRSLSFREDEVYG